MAEATDGRDRYLAVFSELEREVTGGAAAWTAPLRRSAIERFEAIGFPTARLEDWKYTSVKPIINARFKLPGEYEPNGLTASSLQKIPLTDGESPLLVFVNGRFAADLSLTDGLPDGVTALSMAEALEDAREKVGSHLARYADSQDRAFTALNTALMKDGLFLDVPSGEVVRDPIHLLFISTSSAGGPIMAHPRNILLAGDGSQFTLVETYISMGTGSYLTNTVTEIVAGDHAVIDHYKVQREDESAFHVGAIDARLGRNATFTSHSVSLGGALVRNDLNVRMSEEGGDCTLNGLYVLGGSQHVDNHTIIDHAKPHCSSREIYKGVLYGNSRGVFDGKIIVRPDAQKSDARQVNNNLLLSDDALVDTKPQLEINADDVKCAHAATIGQLDQDALFYLRSRAVDLERARDLLIHGFVNEMLDRIRLESVRADLDGLLHRRLDRGGDSEREP
jgi:Fe-S cluster assembly protein SufD